jgi:hypothetical protein
VTTLCRRFGKLGPPSTLAVQATNEMPGAKDLDKYKWEAAFVMIVWLLIVLFGKILIRKNG